MSARRVHQQNHWWRSSKIVYGWPPLCRLSTYIRPNNTHPAYVAYTVRLKKIRCCPLNLASAQPLWNRPVKEDAQCYSSMISAPRVFPEPLFSTQPKVHQGAIQWNNSRKPSPFASCYTWLLWTGFLAAIIRLDFAAFVPESSQYKLDDDHLSMKLLYPNWARDQRSCILS